MTAPPVTPPPVLSRRRVNIVSELGLLSHKNSEACIAMWEIGLTNSLESQGVVSDGHTKKVDGLSLRKLWSLRKLEEAFSWCLRGVGAEWFRPLPNVNLRVDGKITVL